MSDLAATEEAFARSVAAVPTERDVVEVAGPDAATYLHGQLSQNVTGLAVGASVPSLLLQPQGKVDAWLRLSRLADDRFWLDVDAGYGQAVLDRLNRFKLRVALELTLSIGRPTLAVRGPGAAAGPEALGFTAPEGGAILAWPLGLPGFDVPGFDVIGAGAVVPPGITTGPVEALEALRIRHGWPAMGRELDQSTIPAASGVVEVSVDFTKGCYVGQELVARVDSRGGNTPTHLRGLRLEHPADLDPGAEIRRGDEVIGHLTSYAPGSSLGPIGLGYLKRGVEVPVRAEVIDGGGARVAVEIVALPMT